MTNAHDTLYRYTEGVESGRFDKDLTDEERAAVVGLLRMTLAVLSTYGATPARELAAMMYDAQAPVRVNERLRDILFGCLTDGWTRTGLA